ncbi:MAG: tetratricopeptide repeat protein [Verrucomicrobiales bacterium]
MELVQTLQTAVGWLELGLPEDALRELEGLSARDRMQQQALEVKLVAQMKAGHWNGGADTGRLLCLRDPQEPRFFIHAAYCLHETGDTVAARNFLMKGPSNLMEEPLFHYNIACYYAVLGEAQQARVHLTKAFAMDEGLRDVAEKDQDLSGLGELPR